MTLNEATEMVSTCASVKLAIGVGLFTNALLNLGTERHLKFYTEAWSGKVSFHHLNLTSFIIQTTYYTNTNPEYFLYKPCLFFFLDNLYLWYIHSINFSNLSTFPYPPHL